MCNQNYENLNAVSNGTWYKPALYNLRIFCAQTFHKTTRLLLTSITRYVAVGVAAIVIHIVLVRCDWNKVSYRLLK